MNEELVMELDDANDIDIVLDSVNMTPPTGGPMWEDIWGKPFSSVDDQTLKVVSGKLYVNTTDVAQQDNTKPITSSGVQTIVGNIEVLLGLI